MELLYLLPEFKRIKNELWEIVENNSNTKKASNYLIIWISLENDLKLFEIFCKFVSFCRTKILNSNN